MLRGKILEELSLSQRIVRAGSEVVLRFVVLAPDCEHTVMVQLPDDMRARMERINVVRFFMVMKAATGFLHASELMEPDAIMAVAVTREDVAGAIQRITRQPLSFAAPEWFGREAVDDALIQLLPPKRLDVSQRDLEFMEQAFEQESVPGIRWVRPGEEI